MNSQVLAAAAIDHIMYRAPAGIAGKMLMLLMSAAMVIVLIVVRKPKQKQSAKLAPTSFSFTGGIDNRQWREDSSRRTMDSRQ